MLVTRLSLRISLPSIVICNSCSFIDAERRALEEELKRTRLQAYAPGMQKNHRSQWRSYLAFWLYFDLTPVPAIAHIAALYCQFLSCTLTPQLISNYLSGVKLLHLMAGFDSPFLQSYEVRLTLRGIQRLAKHIPNRAPAITPDILPKLTSQTAKRLRLCAPFFSPFFCSPGFLTFFLQRPLVSIEFITFVKGIFMNVRRDY